MGFLACGVNEFHIYVFEVKRCSINSQANSVQLAVMLWSSGRRCFCRFVLSVAAAALLVLVVYVHRCVYFDLSATRHLGNGEYSTICRYAPWKDDHRIWPERITITTGASSREFLHLLNLLDSLAAFESSIRVVIWDLGLRPCQVAFLCKKLQLLQVLFVINEFRFTLYPCTVLQVNKRNLEACYY